MSRLMYILRKIKYSEEERRQMVESTDASTLFLVGYMLDCGEGGARKDFAAAYRCFERASDLGHVFARHMCGFMLNLGAGVVRDEELALKLFVEAADQGCGVAADDAGRRWYNRGEYRQATHYYALAVTFHFNYARVCLDTLLREHHMEACPFGEWEPTRFMHLQVPPKIKTSMFTALLVLRARRNSPTWVAPHVARLILSYVCTKSGWENL